MSTTRARQMTEPALTATHPRDLRRLWRTGLAVLAPFPGLTLCAQILVSPYRVDASFTEIVGGVAGDPARAQLAGWLGLLFSLTVLPGIFALTWVSRRHAPRLALVGGLLASIGFAVGFSLPDSGAAAAVAVRADLDPAHVQAIHDAIFGHPLVSVTLIVFSVGTSLGLLLLGVALWRSRLAPRWLAALLALSGPAHVLVPGGTAAAAVTWGLTGVGALGASLALLQLSNDDFDPAPGRGPVPSGSALRLWHDTRTPWRILLAVTAPLAAVFVAVARFLLPYDMADAPESIFAAMVSHPGFETVSAWAGTGLAPTCVSGVVAVAWLTRRRTPVATTVGLLLAYGGFVCLFLGNSFGDLLAQVVAQHPELDRATAYALGYGLESSAVAGVTGTLFVFGHLIGTVILGIALWRSRVMPSWIALALAVSQPIHLLSVLSGNRPLDLVGWGSTALGFAAAGWVLLHTPNDEFDLPPVKPDTT